MKLESLFDIGDSVYYASAVKGDKTTPCVDCGGKGKLKVESKNWYASCPVCRGYGTIFEFTYVPMTTKLTIGQIRLMYTRPKYDEVRSETPVEEYMCEETGIGSGSVYSSERLFLSLDQAEAAALILVTEANQRRKEMLGYEETERLKRIAEMEKESNDEY